MKLQKLFITILCFTALAIHCSADTIFTNDNGNIAVSFADNNTLTLNEKEAIANHLIQRHENSMDYSDNQVQTASLMCSLLGHKTAVSSVSVIEHKVSSTQPRCLETFYNVETCTRCDYENFEYLTSTYIYCCPND